LTEVVLDASVIARWFGPMADPPSAMWRTDFETGRIDITVPALRFLELVNVASRQWRWTEDRLLALVRSRDAAWVLTTGAPLRSTSEDAIRTADLRPAARAP